MLPNHPLDRLFRPHAVAVIGGSRDPRSMSGTVYVNLTHSFRGPLFLVNPAAAAAGMPHAYASILDVPEPVDLALVAVPARLALLVVRQCLEKKVGAIVMITAGFAELGDAEHDPSTELVGLIRASAARLVGPNCLGIVSTARDWPINASFGPPDQPTGNIAVATQSGALSFVLTEYFRLRNLGLTELVSLGNKLDLDETDFLAYWHDASSAAVFVLYLESISRPRPFLDAVQRIAATRPVLVMKSGGTEEGRRAAGSHTAALATSDRLTDAVLRQSGAMRVSTLAELCEATTLMARQPVPRGRRAAIITNAGGPGVMTTDALAQRGWRIPEFSAELQAKLRAVTSPLMSVHNPVDLIGSVDEALFGQCVDLICASGEVDVVVPVYVPRLPATSEAIVRTIARQATQPTHPPVFAAVVMESEGELVRLQTLCEPVPCFPFPDAAASALTRAAEYGEWLSRRKSPPVSAPIIDRARVVKVLQQHAAKQATFDGWLDPDHTMHLMDACQLSTPHWRLVRSVDDAITAAGELQYPLAVKAVVPGVIHKRAAGALALDLRNSEELAAACHELSNRFPQLSAFFVQEFRPAEQELIVGVQWEKQFGHVIGLGRGGSSVERQAQIAFRILPLTHVDACELVDQALPQFAASPLRAGLVELLRRVAALVEAVPTIRELDLNPVGVDDHRQSLVVLDARILVRECD